MSIEKQLMNFSVPWEVAYGYEQAVRVGDTIYISGQLSHDEAGNFVAGAPVDENGKILDHSNIAKQMQQIYINVKKVLEFYGASLANIVEEVVYVTDMDEAFSVAGDIRKAAYGTLRPQVASTLLVTPRLAFSYQLVEIKFIAKVDI